MSTISGAQAGSPILHLNKDILSAIFMLNADMFSYKSALYTTQGTSQVCKEWRNILLDSPAIWGRLLDFDSLQWRQKKWWKEVLRRSGTSSSLWIRVTSLQGGDKAARKIKGFLFSVLEDHWQRVEKLVVSMDVDKIHPSHWQAMYTPAPRLQVFDIKLYGISNKHDSPGDALFNDVAPSLRTFHTQGVKFGLRAPWLSGLLSLQVRDSVAILDLLRALEMMPALTALRFEHFMSAEPNTEVNLPTVSLPKLEAIVLWCKIVEGITLLHHIIPRRGCLLAIHNTMIEPQSPVPENLSLHPLSRFAKEYCEVHEPSMTSLDLSSKAFHFEIKGARQDRAGFSIDIYSHYDSDILSAASLTNLLAACNFPPVNMLPEVELKHFEFPSSELTLDIFLRHFVSINTLSSNEDMLGNLLALQEKSSSLLLPRLEHVKLERFSSSYFNPVDVFVSRFLRLRRDAGHPIQTLDLTKCNPDISPRLAHLEEMTGLKILWNTWGSAEILEYTCGSGHPEKIPFPRGAVPQVGFEVITTNVNLASFF